MPDTLLVEVRTEELPPHVVHPPAEQDVLHPLAGKFPYELAEYLKKEGFADGGCTYATTLVTPRRFAAVINGVRAQANPRPTKRRGPQWKDCFDEGGNPLGKLHDFMREVGETDKAKIKPESIKGKDYAVWHGTKPGVAIHDDKVLEKMVMDALNLASAHLPVMRWNAEKYAFIRPVRGLIMMHGKRVIEGKIMGVQSGNITRGHPALADRDITITNAAGYEDTLRRAYVIIDNDERVKTMNNDLQVSDDDGRLFSGFKGGTTSNKEEWRAFADDNAALCEYPQVYRGTTDKAFWDFPPECVESCLIKHLKCLPFFAREGNILKLTNFFFVADNAPENPDNIINGFNAVVRARLRDVDFYRNADGKMSKEEAREKLGGIVYHHKLGSQKERAARIAKLAEDIDKILKLNDNESAQLQRAAEVCKLDLPTMMVGEYPELAGLIASMHFCKVDVADIVKRHGDNSFRFRDGCDDTALPSIALFLADKLEKIAGMFIIGEKPAGRKDPRGLRRAAGQIADMLAPPHKSGMSKEVAEKMGEVSLAELINIAGDAFVGYDKHKGYAEEMRDFIAKRVWLPGHIRTEVSNAINALRLDSLAQIPRRCEALQGFLRQPEAAVLIAANKRINNILRKSSMSPNAEGLVWSALLQEGAETALYECVNRLESETKQLIASGDYQGALEQLATAAAPIGEFFDKCMVNDKDDRVRENRLALLLRLQRQLNTVADLSML